MHIELYQSGLLVQMPDPPTVMTEKQRKHKAERSRRDMCNKRNSWAPYPPRPKKKAPVPPTAPVPLAQTDVHLKWVTKQALADEIKADPLTAMKKK